MLEKLFRLLNRKHIRASVVRFVEYARRDAESLGYMGRDSIEGYVNQKLFNEGTRRFPYLGLEKLRRYARGK